jgi:hypothetical protein
MDRSHGDDVKYSGQWRDQRATTVVATGAVPSE